MIFFFYINKYIKEQIFEYRKIKFHSQIVIIYSEFSKII